MRSENKIALQDILGYCYIYDENKQIFILE